MNACAALAESIARLADRGLSSRRFLRELGRVAGVRRGPLWLLDAAGGGTNLLRGRGFTQRSTTRPTDRRGTSRVLSPWRRESAAG